ncbi:phosphate transport system regulatory protein PhoU [Bremerella cremea]|uniref:Phosphate-specific transport system accessory protein PhoU n=1 Tax=Blastopirellula marina TaxID=124 RepID=A0A2S8FDK2_9BACT|nr:MULTISPECIES: phosphate signaling complex protein PhoU [Pirellulaceae]PQO30236.1 phosphate transport system regulatory protein PhoU [Blastopirellula marina]RCS43587.1 phosphate transport system regulatory protein PhoU [Bremerella cremea]
MPLHLQRDLDHLHHEVLSLSGIVEEMLEKATRALFERNAQIADEVIGIDIIVDEREVQIEEECLKALALHQPVAVDLRRIATVLKVNNDLERMADLTVNLAERAKSVIEYPMFVIPQRLACMADMAKGMVSDVLDSFVNMDCAAAARVGATDERVDRLNCEVIEELQRTMRERPDQVVPALHCFSASRHIERISDHATNISDDVIYMVEGTIVRHRFSGGANSPFANG